MPASRAELFALFGICYLLRESAGFAGGVYSGFLGNFVVLEKCVVRKYRL